MHPLWRSLTPLGLAAVMIFIGAYETAHAQWERAGYALFGAGLIIAGFALAELSRTSSKGDDPPPEEDDPPPSKKKR